MEFVDAPKEPTSNHNQDRTTGSAPRMPDVKTEQIASSNPNRRKQANQWSVAEVQAIGAPLTPESLCQLKGPLEMGNNGARKEAIRQIWKHASSGALREECVSILAHVLKHCGDWKDRREAAMRLGQITCPSAEEALKQALNDIRVPVKEQVADSLNRIKASLSKTTKTGSNDPHSAEGH